jgi:hypothetical protein
MAVFEKGHEKLGGGHGVNPNFVEYGASAPGARETLAVLSEPQESRHPVRGVQARGVLQSLWGKMQVAKHHEYNLDEMCKSNRAYCDEPEHKGEPLDNTFCMLGFSTREYAERFAKAFKHAVELCGGKRSAFSPTRLQLNPNT